MTLRLYWIDVARFWKQGRLYGWPLGEETRAAPALDMLIPASSKKDPLLAKAEPIN